MSNVYKSLTMAFVQSIVGVFKSGALGLIVGNMSSHVAANLKLLTNFFKFYEPEKLINIRLISKVSRRYSKFPKYMMPATLLNTASSKLIELSLPLIYGLNTLGGYFLVQRILAKPGALIGTSVSQVFFQNLSVIKNRRSFRVHFWKVLVALALTSFFLFSLLYFIITDIFAFVFGSEWVEAGEMAKVLIPLFAIQFCVSPLTSVNQVLENTHLILVWQSVLFIVYALIILNTYINDLSLMKMLEHVVIFVSACYLCYLIIIGAIVERRKY